MKFALDSGLLTTDMDAKGFNILNCSLLEAENVTSATDDRLYDKRLPPAGSITDNSVAADAGIVQPKLSLNGTIPTPWLGTDPWTAARGDLVERLVNKNALGGYAGLDAATGKLPVGSVPVSGKSGTVTEIKIELPADFSMLYESVAETGGGIPTTIPGLKLWLKADSLGDPLVAGGSVKGITGYWNAVPPESWFGINPLSAGAVAPIPGFHRIPFPASMIGGVDGSRITSGVFDKERLPADALLSHPGFGLVDGSPTDYYARDGTYKVMSKPVTNQPTLADPAITVIGYQGDMAMVNLTHSNPKPVTFFANLNKALLDTFIEVGKQPVKVDAGRTLSVYAARIGWNNSSIVNYLIPPSPLLGEGGVTLPPPL